METPQTPLSYLKKELNFNVVEWKSLGAEGQETMKRWAEEEMAALGITRK